MEYLSVFIIHYWTESMEENYIEIPAYSKEQAIFLSSCDENSIISIERVISKVYAFH